MFKNYLLTALRNLKKQKSYFVINVLGLSIGIAACLLCYMHVKHEMSYDQFHTKSEQIFRVVNGYPSNSDQSWVKVSAPMAPKIMEEIPEVLDFTRMTKITYNQKITVTHDQKAFNEERFYMADPSLFSMFDFPLVSGQKETVLEDQNSVVLSESMASKYFGKENPMGQSIRVNNQFDFIVSGVFKDLPTNTHLEFDFLTSFENLERIFPGTSLTSNWGQYNYFAFILLKEGADPDRINHKIHGMNVKLKNREFNLQNINLQLLTDIHFQDNRGNIKQAYDIKYLYIYAAIALGILLISFINFVNLSTAGSTKRVREVGVRKVVGARKQELSLQFIIESYLVVFIAIVLSLLMVSQLLLPMVNEVLNSNIPLDFSDTGLIATLVIILVVIGMASGAYIAFFVASFSPVNALKSNIRLTNKGLGLKNMLIGTQFVISMMLILGSIFIYQQLNFLKAKDLGLDQDQVLNISLYDQKSRASAQLLKKELSKISGVQSVSASSFNPGRANWNQTVWWEGQVDPISMFIHLVDRDFVSTLDIVLLEGDIDQIESLTPDKKYRYILNETAVNVIGWESALGKSFSSFGNVNWSPILGVVGDFNFMSLHHKVEPAVLAISDSFSPSQLLVKVEGSDLSTTLEQIENTFSKVVSSTPFEYHFIDEQFEKLYIAELRTGKVVSFLTVVAIFLAALGLYGLISYAVRERTREMAIRKILGMNLKDTLGLLSMGYIKLLFVASLIAGPLLLFLMDRWLDNFSYRIDMGWPVFIMAFGMVLAVLLITVGIKVMQVSRANPVDGLRYE